MFRRNQFMWTTLIFSGTAGLFLIWTFSVLWHLR